MFLDDFLESKVINMGHVLIFCLLQVIARATPPHIVLIYADDLGWYATQASAIPMYLMLVRLCSSLEENVQVK